MSESPCRIGLGGTRCSLLGACSAVALLGVLGTFGGCAVRLPAAEAEGGADGKPCSAPMDCPQPKNPCLLAYCMEQVCQLVPSPEGVLPPESQKTGDCQQLYCDGNGQAVTYPAAYDGPPDDKNPCTEERCEGLEPKSIPKPVGAPCDAGTCNGKGKCGTCSPKAEECSGNAVRRCSDDGQWTAPQPCPSVKPVCAAARCIGIADFDLGRAHACARLEDASLRCWGSNDRGQLGTAGPSASAAPISPAPLGTLVLGRRHGCGIDAGGSLWCWGANDYGQLGNGGYDSSASPVQVQLADAVGLGVGAAHSCALGADNTVQCWGRNDRGQLGRGSPPKSPLEPLEPPAPPSPGKAAPSPVPGLAGAMALDLSGSASCIRLATFPTWRCWGLPSYELPTAPDKKAQKKLAKVTAPAPAPVEGLGPCSQVGLGQDFACALAEDGTVQCWGANDRGQLGDGTSQDRFRAAPVAGLASVQQMALGDAFGCALLQDGSVQCWGANDRGQLGRGAAGAPEPRAATVTGLGGVRELRAGSEFACALRQEGQLLCWGAGSAGQLGSGASSDAPSPGPVTL